MTYFFQLITNSAKKVLVHVSVSALLVICSESIPRNGIMRSKGLHEFVVLRHNAGFASRELVRMASLSHLWRCCSHRTGAHSTRGSRMRRYTIRWHWLTWWCETENTHSAHLSSPGQPPRRGGDPMGRVKAYYVPGTISLSPPPLLPVLLTSETLKLPSQETKAILCKVKTSSSGPVLHEVYK